MKYLCNKIETTIFNIVKNHFIIGRNIGKKSLVYLYKFNDKI